MGEFWDRFVVEFRDLDAWQQALVVAYPFVILLLTAASYALTKALMNRVEPVLTRWWGLLWLTTWRAFFPMTERRFNHRLDRACEAGDVSRGPVINQAAVMNVRGCKRVGGEPVPFHTPVVVAYHDRAFHLCCRLPCPDPKGLPVDGGEGEYAWSVAETGGRHTLTLVRSCPDRISAPVRAWLTETVARARKVAGDLDEFVKALAS